MARELWSTPGFSREGRTLVSQLRSAASARWMQAECEPENYIKSEQFAGFSHHV